MSLSLRSKAHAHLKIVSTAWPQVGTGSRSEKIKTYHWKDSRVSDHRTKKNYPLDNVLAGSIEDSIQDMIALDQQEALAQLQEDVNAAPTLA